MKRLVQHKKGKICNWRDVWRNEQTLYRTRCGKCVDLAVVVRFKSASRLEQICDKRKTNRSERMIYMHANKERKHCHGNIEMYLGWPDRAHMRIIIVSQENVGRKYLSTVNDCIILFLPSNAYAIHIQPWYKLILLCIICNPSPFYWKYKWLTGNNW